MTNLFKSLYYKAEELQGPRLFATLVAVFFVFLLLGITINYASHEILNSNEFGNSSNQNSSITTLVEETYEEGVITYIDPFIYPEDNISYYLADITGKEIVLLKARDQKLEVLEGLYVKVYGKKTRTLDGKKEVILVERIAVKNSNQE